MSTTNEWEDFARQTQKIQQTKNDVLWPGIFTLLKKHAPTGRIFDEGCGWGEFTYALSTRGYDTIGHDPALTMVKNAKKLFPSVTFLRNEELQQQESTLVGKFDIVTSLLVLCILEESDQRALLQRLKRFCRKDGTILISFCHPCFDVQPESVVSHRITSCDARYGTTFEYEKIIKENSLRVHDIHRPLSNFLRLFFEEGLVIIDGIESIQGETSFVPDFLTLVLKPLDIDWSP